MRDHVEGFERRTIADDKLMRESSIAVAGLSGDIDSSKVRSGQVGESRQQLSTDVAEELDAIWADKITSEFGFADYGSMIATLKL